MIDERAAIYAWSAFLWGGWAAALVTAALMFPHQITEMVLRQGEKQ